MIEPAQTSLAEDAIAVKGEATSSAEETEPQPRPPMLDRTGPLLALFLFVGLVVFIAAYLTVHSQTLDPWPEANASSLTIGNLLKNGGSIRTNIVLSRWLNEGYFHYFGLTVRMPAEYKPVVYRSSTGGYIVSTFILEKLYVTFFGHYSWRLAAIHNQLVSLLLSALLGLLAYRVSRRIGVDSRLAYAAGTAVVIVMFAFPYNLAHYYEMSAQAYWLLFAVLFLVIEERCLDGRRTLVRSIMQAAAAFLMTYMEYIAGLAFLFVMAAMLLVLEQRRGSWKRFLLVAVAPCLAALALYGMQLYGVSKRFPDIDVAGNSFMFRSGLDGESVYYGNHLDIAMRRDARKNWVSNGEYLFRWKWVFVLGAISTMALIAAYVAGRLPRIAIEVLVSLTGAWLVYAAVFSQSMVIHPYLYDVMLFTPLSIALFAFIPALAESLTRRTGAFLLVALLCAFWYTLFEMRLYALRYPKPGAKAGAPTQQSRCMPPVRFGSMDTVPT